VTRAGFHDDGRETRTSRAGPPAVCGVYALIDGNNRLAWAAAVVFIGLNNDGPVPDVDVDRAETVMLAVTDGSLAEVSAIARRTPTPGRR
jgi:hypothetical protein